MTALLASAGVLAAVRVASADIGAQVSYLCATPKATYGVSLGIKAEVPATGKINAPVRIGDVGVTLKAPGSLRSELARTGQPDSTGAAPAPSLNGVASIAVNVGQGQTSVNAGWPTFSLTSGSDQTNQVLLQGTGAVPALLTDQAGQVVWKAGQMVLRLSAEGQKASTVTLTCTPKSGTVLGRLALKGRTTPSALPKRSPLANQPAGDDSRADCIVTPSPFEPGGGMNPDPRLDPPPAPPGVNPGPLRPIRPGTPKCGKAAGFGNLGKLKAAIPLGAQIRFRMNIQSRTDLANNYIRSNSYGSTATTPSTGTALGFGFMPTTATVLTRQAAPPGGSSEMGNLYADGPFTGAPTSFESRAYARSFVDLRVKNISVNGTSLSMGENCHTGALPLNISADLGNDSVGTLSPEQGGTYTGSVYVPGFSGCGAGEDLTPLVDATSAGTSNYLKVESGLWCLASPDVPGGCTDEPEPLSYTVLPGKAVEATVSPFTLTADNGNSVQCESARLKMNFKRGRYLSMYRIATVDGAQFKKCVRGNGGVPTEVHGAGFPWTLHVNTTQGVPGQWAMQLAGFKLEMTGSDGCNFSLNRISDDGTTDMPATLGEVSVDPSKDRLSFGTGNPVAVGVEPQCSDPDPDLQPTATWYVAGDFSYSPHQKITSP
ncbi:DUF6801 domain-containing protein [Actinomadura oligospora]|uniref:DUF6801 domain-containing protein n=1 Tax=Actinomadura oligospora TaxID=111804 RepID=UPI0012FB2E65|nr:DUF6801 domain-containing protein [Actinomadura oligospora]